MEKTKKLIARVLDEAGARCTKRASLLLPEMLAYLRVASNRVKGSLWFLFFLFPFFSNPSPPFSSNASIEQVLPKGQQRQQ